MKQMLCFSFFMLCFLGVSWGQFDYDVSTPYQVVDGEKFYLGEDGKMLAIKRHGKEIYMQSFDARKPSLIKTQKYSETELPKGFVIEKFHKFGNQYYLYFSVWDKENEKEQLFCREIDFDKGAFMGESKLLVKVDGKITGTPLVRFFNRYSVSRGTFMPSFAIDISGGKKFGFSFSQDSSKLIIQYRKKPVEKNDKLSFDIIGMHVYSHGMVQDAGKDITMPYTEKKMNNLDYTVDAEGTPYMLTKVYNDNATSEKVKNPDGKGKVANYKIELFKINLETGNIRITPIETGDKFLTKILLYENSKNEMVSVGYYNSLGPTSTNFFNQDEPPTDGVCVFKLNKDGGVYGELYHEIPVEVINQYERQVTQNKNERKDAKGKAQFDFLALKECLVQKDGSIILVGEQYHVKEPPVQVNIPGMSTSQQRPEYYYEDVLITKINPDGSLGWMQKLPKRQMSNQPQKGGMSFQYIHDESNKNHYVMYLDNVKNIDLDMDKVPAKHVDGAGGFLTAYKVNDATGKVSKENLFDMRDVKGINVYQFNTDRIIHTGDNYFVVEVYKKGKEDVLIRINVK